MGKPKKVIPDLCRGFVLAEEERDVTTRDCILYALGTAACQVHLVPGEAAPLTDCSYLMTQDPLDEKDLRYCYEGSSLGFSVLPTFATTFMSVAAIFEGLDKCPGLPDFNPMRLLHGEHKLTLFQPLQADIRVRCRAAIQDVLDKRVDSGLAKMGGFSRPILHGLCTLGIATRHIIKECLDGDPARVASISCRFTAPTTPGDRLRVCMWGVNTSTVVFQVLDLSNKGTVVLRGTLEIKPLTTGNAKL
ncbi:peroxisomal multifunctional enzyme type 2-like [Cyclospora cayetanensis]|uniref:Peroxisomal multifunctional enzyme type 2-like n=1 Tax=Cyclospora cayetanensis TaxID=88456 RepID=A0A6P6RUV4_9EIME|nr:peroxisomal multifunctional enzyme type 2-like [Cyclospora cayetanensis]